MLGLGRQARRGIHAALRRVGLDVVRYDAARFPELRRAELAAREQVDVVLDVGANDGSFAASLRRAGFEGRIVSFEPLADAYARLARVSAADPAWHCRRVALGAGEGEVVLNVAANTSSSSLLPMTARHVAGEPGSAYVRTEAVAIARLDALRSELLTPGERVYLKVDVQGAELEVLRGAEETLVQAVVVDAELSLAALYEGAPGFQQVLDYLAARGFVLLDLSPVFSDPLTGALLQVDGLFARRG